MITHIVFMKLKDQANADEAVQRLASLDGRVETLISMRVGKDVVRSPRSYDVGLIADFHDMTGLETYRTHPAHVEVADYLHEVMSEIVSVDFES